MDRLTMKNKRLKTLVVLAILACCALPVSADQHSDKPIPWSQLPEDARTALAPMADRWEQLKPQQQHRLLRKVGDKKFKQHANRWKELSPEERERIKQSRGRFKELPQEKRKELRERWKNMSEGERREAANARRALSHFSPQERHRLLEELRDLPPKERRAKLDKLNNGKTKEAKSRD
jgi:hypothetical protein